MGIALYDQKSNTHHSKETLHPKQLQRNGLQVALSGMKFVP